MGTTGVRHKRTGTTPSRHAHGLSAFRSASDLKTAVVSSFNMGLISPPIQYTLMQKIPSCSLCRKCRLAWPSHPGLEASGQKHAILPAGNPIAHYVPFHTQVLRDDLLHLQHLGLFRRCD